MAILTLFLARLSGEVAKIWFLATVGDSLKRNTICRACTPRRGSQALPSRESLSHLHNVAPDSAAMARHPTPSPSCPVLPLAARVAMRPRGGPGSAYAGRRPGPVHRVGPPRSGG